MWLCSSSVPTAAGNFPGWFAAFDTALDADGSIDLAGRFPLLELFLSQCGPAWDSAFQTRLSSDIWTDLDNQGGEHYLQAAATAAGGARLLVLQSLPQGWLTTWNSKRRRSSA